MDKIITLTHPDGTVTRLSGVEELPAVMPLIVSGVVTVSVVGQVATAPLPVPAFVPAQRLVRQFIEGMEIPGGPAAPGATPRRSRSRSVYLTESEADILRVMRQFPDGITTPEIATLLDVQVNHVSAHLWRLRTQRPYADTTDPLVVKVKDKRFRVTPLGMRLKLLVATRPMAHNHKLGW